MVTGAARLYDAPMNAQSARWSIQFWSELVNLSRSVIRLGDEATIRGWTIRLAWDVDGKRGTVLVRRDTTVLGLLKDRVEHSRTIYPNFDPRREADDLLRDLYAIDHGRYAA